MSEFLGRAKQALRSAELLLSTDDTIGAANRAYYAIFYAARAAILHVATIDIVDVKTHNGLRRLFELHLVKSGLIDRRIASHFADIESTRIAGDYYAERPQKAEVEASIRDATAFVDACQKLVESHQP